MKKLTFTCYYTTYNYNSKQPLNLSGTVLNSELSEKLLVLIVS